MADQPHRPARDIPYQLAREVIYALTGLGVPPALLGGGLPRLTLRELAQVIDAPDLEDHDLDDLGRLGLVERASDGRLSTTPAAAYLVELVGYTV